MDNRKTTWNGLLNLSLFCSLEKVQIRLHSFSMTHYHNQRCYSVRTFQWGEVSRSYMFNTDEFRKCKKERNTLAQCTEHLSLSNKLDVSLEQRPRAIVGEAEL